MRKIQIYYDVICIGKSPTQYTRILLYPVCYSRTYIYSVEFSQVCVLCITYKTFVGLLYSVINTFHNWITLLLCPAPSPDAVHKKYCLLWWYIRCSLSFGFVSRMMFSFLFSFFFLYRFFPFLSFFIDRYFPILSWSIDRYYPCFFMDNSTSSRLSRAYI